MAIARMVLKRPRLLVLDEATSALDVDTEQQVTRNLAEVYAAAPCCSLPIVSAACAMPIEFW